MVRAYDLGSQFSGAWFRVGSFVWAQDWAVGGLGCRLWGSPGNARKHTDCRALRSYQATLETPKCLRDLGAVFGLVQDNVWSLETWVSGVHLQAKS